MPSHQSNRTKPSNVTLQHRIVSPLCSLCHYIAIILLMSACFCLLKFKSSTENPRGFHLTCFDFIALHNPTGSTILHAIDVGGHLKLCGCVLGANFVTHTPIYILRQQNKRTNERTNDKPTNGRHTERLRPSGGLSKGFNKQMCENNTTASEGNSF